MQVSRLFRKSLKGLASRRRGNGMELSSSDVHKRNAKETIPKSEPGEAGPIWRRKKDSTDMQFSRRLRKSLKGLASRRRGNGMELSSSDVAKDCCFNKKG